MNDDRALIEREGAWPIEPYKVPEVGTRGPSSEAPILDLPTLVRIVREWKWLILGAVALGLATAIVYTLLATPLYRSWVTIEVNPPTVEVIDERNQEPVASSTWDLVATQVGLLQSRNVAERAAQDLNLANNPEIVDQTLDPASRLKVATHVVVAGLKVLAPEEGRLIRFNYVSASPQLSAQTANAVAEAFINSTLERRYEASAYARNFLQRQIARTRSDLEQSERLLVSYAQQQGIINTTTGSDGSSSGDGSSPQGQSLVALNQALAEATARRVAAEGAYRQARAAGATTEVTSDTQQLRQARAALEAEYQQKGARLKPDHPEMLGLRSQINELNRQISREAAAVSASRANSLLAEFRAALAAERALQARVEQLKGAVLNLRGRSIQYAILQRDVDTNRALYDALLQRYKEIGVAGGVGSAPVSIVDLAEVPSSPFRPSLPFNVIIGLLGGLIAGILAAIGLEYLNDTIKTRSDVRNKLGLPCLGAIPKRPRREQFLEDLRDPSSSISESYSTVVTSLRFSTDAGAPKSVLVTSARAGEGKSASALALAQNFARRGFSVVLIDSDLRRPAFKAPSTDRGLAKLLTSDELVADHLYETHIENLWLLPGGVTPPNPADLLATKRIQRIIKEASAQFDVVIIDAPPVLGLADAPLLASACEDVMLVIESGRTRTAAAVEALGRLRAAGGQVIGATLTKATEEASAYGYGYGYGYSYSQTGVQQKKRPQIDLVEDQSTAEAASTTS